MAAAVTVEDPVVTAVLFHQLRLRLLALVGRMRGNPPEKGLFREALNAALGTRQTFRHGGHSVARRDVHHCAWVTYGFCDADASVQGRSIPEIAAEMSVSPRTARACLGVLTDRGFLVALRQSRRTPAIYDLSLLRWVRTKIEALRTGTGDVPSAAHRAGLDVPSAAHRAGLDVPSAAHRAGLDVPSAAHRAGLDVPSAAHRAGLDVPSAAHRAGLDVPSAAHRAGLDVPSAAHHAGLDVPSAAHHAALRGVRTYEVQEEEEDKPDDLTATTTTATATTVVMDDVDPPIEPSTPSTDVPEADIPRSDPPTVPQLELIADICAELGVSVPAPATRRDAIPVIANLVADREGSRAAARLQATGAAVGQTSLDRAGYASAAQCEGCKTLQYPEPGGRCPGCGESMRQRESTG